MSNPFESVWRPVVKDSIDGEPLATEISHLFWEFPYERLPPSKFIANLLRPELVVVIVIFYLTSKEPLQALCHAVGIKGKSDGFRLLVAFHNCALQTFSFIVMWNIWPIVWQHYQFYGLRDTYCDPNGTLWESGFGSWVVIFYVSKLYEFLDTWILVMKGKEPSFLQRYHHAGVVLFMWGGVASQSAWIQALILLNSVIHTVMYGYFFARTMFPRLEIKWAKHLTTAQMVQCATGFLHTLPTQFMGSSCDTSSSRFVLFFMQLYVLGLLILFFQFSKKKYGGKKVEEDQKKKGE